MGTILAINLASRIWKIDYAKEAENMGGSGGTARVINRVVTPPLRLKPSTSWFSEILRS